MAIDLGIDESGSSDVLLVSAQLGITNRAVKHKSGWKQILRDAGNIPYFHSKEFDNYSYGIFARSGLDRQQRTYLLNDLIRLTRERMLIGMTVKVTKSLFDQKADGAFKSRWGTAYTFCIQLLVACGYIYAEQMRLEPRFNILIENGHVHSGDAVRKLGDTKQAGITSEIPLKILSVGLGAKADHPILQAADMIAYSEWAHMKGEDSPIFDALHPENNIHFEPELVDADKELVSIITDDAKQWLERRREFGRKRAEQIEKAKRRQH